MLVLVTDDDRAVREALERALQLAGYEVELASDGDSAVADATAGERRPTCGIWSSPTSKLRTIRYLGMP